MSEFPVHVIGLVVHPTRAVDRSLRTILEFVGSREVRVLARESDRARVGPDVELIPDDRFTGEVDSLLALGGDGTMLGAMRLTVDRPVPVLGVNHGNLGFLVEVGPSELPEALKRLAAGDYTLERHSCLVAGVDGDGLATRFGFNDVVLSRPGRGTISVDLQVNGQQYGYYRADAVIVSTPIGSTAYNYAAGGPVLSPSSEAVVITPVAPMAGINRPVVLGAGDRVTLAMSDDSVPAAIDVDGTEAGDLPPGHELAVSLRREAATVVRLAATAYASRNRVKLSLLDLPLRRDQLIELIPPELRRPRLPEE